MSEIIGLHVGEAGSLIGEMSWKQLAQQHNVNQSNEKDPKGKLYFFQELKGTKKYRARSLFLNNESKISDSILQKNPYSLFDKENVHTASDRNWGIWGQGQYLTQNHDYEDQLRKQVEKCDLLGGFIMTHSAGEGGGSGLASRLIKQAVRKNYYSKVIQTLTVYPDFNLYANPLEVYNTVLTTNSLIHDCDFVIISDLYSAQRVLGQEKSIYSALDDSYRLFATALNEVTSSFRFAGKLNSNLRKLCTNLVMYPRLHFFQQYLSEPNCSIYEHPITSAFKSRRTCLGGQGYPSQQKVSQISAHLRDPLAYEEQMNALLKNCMKGRAMQQTSWIPSPFHLSTCDEVNRQLGKSSSILVAGNGSVGAMRKCSELFGSQYGRRAYCHRYLGCGMDQMQFQEVESNMNDLISEYTQYTGSHTEDQPSSINQQ